ncbi:MAG: acetoacetate--CoA ligase [Alphaproteobacteria bacterium]|nr:acetoacetate--CoA ligase [Alphaproteobacteria bacterium]
MTVPHPAAQQTAPSVLWHPDPNVKDSRIARFARFAQTRGGPDLNAYDTAGFQKLHRWSVEKSEEFWSALWDFCAVVGEKSGPVIEPVAHVPWTQFFVQAQINYTENIFHHAPKDETTPALIARCQNGPSRIVTWRELKDSVSRWEQALRAAGLHEGERVAVYLPNIPETIFIFLAAANIGAVFASAGMEMGPADLISRLSQVAPKMLIAGDGYIHGAKSIERLSVLPHIAQSLPSIQKIIVHGVTDAQPALSGLTNAQTSSDFLAPFEPASLVFARRAFNHPLYILFSSGSTGKPKCFEHSAGGVLLKHLCEIVLHADITPGDRFFCHTTPSWMMWNWVVTGLAAGATLMLYDGNPFYPSAQTQWDFLAAHRCTHHATAAPVILAWQQTKLDLRNTQGLEEMRALIYSAAVLPPHGFDYIHQFIKPDVKIHPFSGGTDIVGGFFFGNLFMPTYAGQINGPALGMDVQAWDEHGQPCADGQAGELVCVNAFPSMPLRFLNDESGERYRAEYFDFFEGKKVWRHGDSIERTPQGQYIIIGRSDATLNQNGVRIGTGAIYDQLAPFMDQLIDFAAVDFSRPDNKQTITVLFLQLKDGGDTVPDALQSAIKKAVKDNITPYAIPTEIIAAPGILKTPNGKKAEVVIKKAIHGKDIPNPSLYGADLVGYYQGVGKSLSEKYK